MASMKEKANLKTGQAIALIVILILNVVWIVCSLILAGGNVTFSFAASVVMFAASVFYTCYGYRVPHGNLMRYLILCFAIVTAIQYVFSDETYPKLLIALSYVIVIMASYMASKLSHYAQCIIISILLLLCQCITTFYYLTDANGTGLDITFRNVMACSGPITLWLAVSSGYIVRYRHHREAGLAEKD